MSVAFVFFTLLVAGDHLSIDASGADGENATKNRWMGGTSSAGASGVSGGSITLVIRSLPERMNIRADGGAGGHGHDGNPGRKGTQGQDGRKGRFFRSPHDGEDGGDGQDGGHGSPGGHGGSGGNVRLIYIPQSDDDYDPRWKERFEISVEAGLGGRGGYGAKGGLGGEGGHGGKKFWGKGYKANGRRGRDGKAGRNAKDGMDGDAGNIWFQEVDHYDSWILEEFLAEEELF